MSSWGYIARRHARKTHPWVVRLNQATDGLLEDIKLGDKLEAFRSVEDVAFWQGRIVCDLLGADGSTRAATQSQVARAFARSSSALRTARRFLAGG